MILKRTITALALAPILLLVVVAGEPWYSLVVVAAVVVAHIELNHLVRAMGWPVPLALQLTTGLAPQAAVLLDLGETGLAAAVTLAAVLPPVVALARHNTSSSRAGLWSFATLSALYMGWLPIHFLLLYRAHTAASQPLWQWIPSALPSGPRWILLTLLATWCSDIFAYVLGRTLGRSAVAPAISPGKTWEGTAGGAVACALVVYPLAILLGLPVAALEGATLGLAIALIGQLGDLVESSLKRAAGVKDSGFLLPGHGGLLDRIDSLLFTVVFMYYYVVWLKV